MKSPIAAFVTMMFVGLWVPPAAIGQAADAELSKAVAARDAARTRGDLVQWARLTTDDFVFIDVAGIMRTKSEQLAQMKANRPAEPPAASPKRDYTYRMHGTTAILTATIAGAEGPRRETHVWVKQEGQWKVAAVQMTQIQKR